MAAHRTLPAGPKPAWLPFAPAAFVFLWSVGYPMAFLGMMSAGPATLLALRYLACVVVLLPLVPLLRVPFPSRLSSYLVAGLVGLLIHVVHFGLNWYALSQGMPLGVIALILSLQPVLTALTAPWLAGQTVRTSVWIGLVLGLGGTVVVILSRSELGAFPPITLLAVTTALVAFTAATLIDRRYGGRDHPVAVASIQFVLAAAITTPAAFAIEGFAFVPTPGLALSVAFLSVGTSLLGLGLLLAMMRYGEAARVTSLLYLVPPCVAVLAWLLFGQPVPPVLWIGMAVASAGVWLAMRRAPPPRPTEPRPD